MPSDREKEIKRRRKRRKQITAIRARAAKATGSEKQVLADKLRNMTPGYKILIDSMGYGSLL